VGFTISYRISLVDDIEKAIIMEKLQIPMEAKSPEFPKE